MASCVRTHGAVASCVRIHIACAFCVGSGTCAARVRPERPERLVRQDAACASGRTFFFLMRWSRADGSFVEHHLIQFLSSIPPEIFMRDILTSYIVDVDEPRPVFMLESEFQCVQQITYPTGPILLGLIESARTQLKTEVLPSCDQFGNPKTTSRLDRFYGFAKSLLPQTAPSCELVTDDDWSKRYQQILSQSFLTMYVSDRLCCPVAPLRPATPFPLRLFVSC